MHQARPYLKNLIFQGLKWYGDHQEKLVCLSSNIQSCQSGSLNEIRIQLFKLNFVSKTVQKNLVVKRFHSGSADLLKAEYMMVIASLDKN